MVLHFRHEETEVQRELPNVVCSKIAEPEFSSHLHHSPTAQSGRVRKTTHCLRERYPRTLFVYSTSQASALPSEPPGLREGSPLQELPEYMLCWGLSCLCFCLPS